MTTRQYALIAAKVPLHRGGTIAPGAVGCKRFIDRVPGCIVASLFTDMALHVDDLIQQFSAWARDRAEIRAVVLVGSHARGMARPDSDVDLVILSVRPERLLTDHAWLRTFGTVIREAREDWGQLQSIRVWYDDGPEVEFGVTHVGWAAPNDESSLAVLRDGFRVLIDHDGVFGFLEKN